MHKRIWIPVAVILSVITMASLVGCGPAATQAVLPPAEATSTEAAPQPTTGIVLPTPTSEPVTLNVGIDYIWDSANPTIGWYNYGLRYLLYDTLVEWTALDKFEPGLAESYEVSDDGLVWTFHIRPGVTFNDGTPCTADEIAWNFNWVQENEIETYSTYLVNVADVEALDPTTLQVTLSDPVGNMEYLMIYVWILPPSVWQDIPADQIGEFEDISAAIGTGPYKMTEWVEGEYAILEANKNYWKGAPAIDRIVYHEYATEDAMVQAMLAGELDLIYSVPFTAVQTLQENPNIEVPIMDSLTFDELIINSFADGTQPASLWDLDIRTAMEYATDRQQIINVAYLGYGVPLNSPVPKPMGDWYNSDMPILPFDIAKANQILDNAGYVDSDGDGVREYSDGTPLDYRMYATEGASNARILEIIADGFSQIGIKATPTLMDEDSLIALYPAYDFDLVYWGWGMDPDPDFSMMIFTCDQTEEYGWNDSGYCASDFDDLYYEQAITVDHAARRQIIWDMQDILYQQKPYIELVNYPIIQAYDKTRFTGFGLECGDLLWKACLLQGSPAQ
jgi:peptide/nickel transport system substrate-binding protein